MTDGLKSNIAEHHMTHYGKARCIYYLITDPGYYIRYKILQMQDGLSSTA